MWRNGRGGGKQHLSHPHPVPARYRPDVTFPHPARYGPDLSFFTHTLCPLDTTHVHLSPLARRPVALGCGWIFAFNRYRQHKYTFNGYRQHKYTFNRYRQHKYTDHNNNKNNNNNKSQSSSDPMNTEKQVYMFKSLV